LPYLELENVSKIYEGGVNAVSNLNLSCEEGELLAIVGPSGCGKSTTLRMVAGLETITEGHLRIGGIDMTTKTSRQRNIALAFETYALYPPMTVYENIAFPLRCVGVPNSEVQERVQEVLNLVEIGDILGKKPGELSGGQKQAVGLARALVRKPSVFLLDEPISHFDARQRGRMRVRIKRLQIKLGITMFYVTHDQLEAMALANKVAIMDFGELQQVGTPDEIYHNPAKTFVAGFIGDPPMNLIECHVTQNNGDLYLQQEEFRLPLPTEFQNLLKKRKTIGNDKVTFGIRPNYVSLNQENKDSFIAGTVLINEYLGEERIYTVQVGENVKIMSLADSSMNIHEGDPVSLELDSKQIRLFDADGDAIR
jgi:multiple sugar transport system ATP-binding protein